MARIFYPRETFSPVPAGFNNGKELLVNEAGEFIFVPTGTVQSLTDGRIDTGAELYRDLKAKHIVYDETSSPLLDLLATKIRTKFDHMIGGTKLHIFFLTLRCDHSCDYCQVSRQTASRGEFDMSTATADRAISLMMDSPSPGIIKVESHYWHSILSSTSFPVPRQRLPQKEYTLILSSVQTYHTSRMTYYITFVMKE